MRIAPLAAATLVVATVPRCTLIAQDSSPGMGRGLAGAWYGTTSLAPDSGLPVAVRLKVAYRDGKPWAALSLPQSRLVDLELPSPYSDSSQVAVRGDTLKLEFTPDIGLAILGRLGLPRQAERIRFDGHLRGDDLVGQLQITQYASPITLRRDAEPRAAREEAVRFRSSGDSLLLGGNLVLPAGHGPFATVIFVTGSDPDTREAWQLEARALAARGVASLLYDKRGVGESVGANHDLASWDDLAGDVEGALAYLRSRKDVVDARRIGLIGQSQGTWIIAKVAARDTMVAFLVSISGSGISAAEQETYRTGALMEADGFSAADIAAARAFQREKFRVARTGLGWNHLDSLKQRLRADSVRWFPGYGTGAAASSLSVLRLYGVLQFDYDPSADLRRIRAPVFVIMGERDRTFPPDVVIQRMKASLAAGGNRRVDAVTMPSASHGLMTPQTWRGQPFRRAVAPAFLDTLVTWIGRQAQTRTVRGSRGASTSRR